MIKTIKISLQLLFGLVCLFLSLQIAWVFASAYADVYADCGHCGGDGRFTDWHSGVYMTCGECSGTGTWMEGSSK